MRGLLMILLYVVGQVALAQTTDQAPAEKPSQSVLKVTSSAPKFVNGTFNVLFKVTSATNEPIPVAIESNHKGLIGYTVKGESCAGGSVNINNIPRLRSDGSGIIDGQPGEFTAGVTRAALIPMNFQCKVQRGDEVSYSIAIYALVGKQWVAQQFSWEQKAVE